MDTNVHTEQELEKPRRGVPIPNCKYDNIQSFPFLVVFGRTMYAIDVNSNGPLLPIALCSPI